MALTGNLTQVQQAQNGDYYINQSGVSATTEIAQKKRNELRDMRTDTRSTHSVLHREILN